MAPFIAMSSAATPIIWQYYINLKCGYVYKKSVPVFHKTKIHSLSHISLVEMVENKLCYIFFFNSISKGLIVQHYSNKDTIV